MESTRSSPAPPGRAPLPVQLLVLGVIVVPLLGLAAALALLWESGFSWTDLCLLVGMYLLTALGVTVGFHRLITHRSFETFEWVKFLLAAIGAMAVQGSMLQWAALHRRHHRYSDAPGDPHSPHPHGGGVRGVLRGAWHAHMGWLFAAVPTDWKDSVKDLTRSRTLRVADALWPVWIVLGLAIPGLIGGLVNGGWPGVWSGVIWGGLVRMFLVHHVTFSVNSACHLWGSRPYRCADQSRNNAVVGVLALGEGWHNAHHAFPTSARHGLRWWQIDVSYYVICVMSWVGLAWNVRVPPEEAQRKADRSRPSAEEQVLSARDGV